MRSSFSAFEALFVSLCFPPVLFFAFLSGWDAIDRCLGVVEVSRFVRDHQALVTTRLSNPKVHTFSLSHDPDDASSLLITVDVDDRKTYEMIENELDEIWRLRFPPKWNQTIRNKEELGNNSGYASLGFRELLEGIERLVVSAVVSIFLPALCVVSVLQGSRRRVCRKPSVDKILS